MYVDTDTFTKVSIKIRDSLERIELNVISCLEYLRFRFFFFISFHYFQIHDYIRKNI